MEGGREGGIEGGAFREFPRVKRENLKHRLSTRVLLWRHVQAGGDGWRPWVLGWRILQRDELLRLLVAFWTKHQDG